MSVGDLVDRVVIGIVARSQLGGRRVVRRPSEVGNLLASHIERTGKRLLLCGGVRRARLDGGGEGGIVELLVQVLLDFSPVPRKRRLELGSKVDGLAAECQRIGGLELTKHRPIRVGGLLCIGQKEVRDGAVRGDAALLGGIGRAKGHGPERRPHVLVAECLELGREHVDDVGVGAVDRVGLPGGERLFGRSERLCVGGRGGGGALALGDGKLRARGELVRPAARAVGHLASDVLAHLIGSKRELTRRGAVDGRVARGGRSRVLLLAHIPLIFELGVLGIEDFLVFAPVVLVVGADLNRLASFDGCIGRGSIDDILALGVQQADGVDRHVRDRCDASLVAGRRSRRGCGNLRLPGSIVRCGRCPLGRLLVGVVGCGHDVLGRPLLDVGCGISCGVVDRGLLVGVLRRLLLDSGLGLRRRRELIDCLGERGRRHEGRRRNEREQQREHAFRQRFFGFHIPRLLPFRGPGGQAGSAGYAPAIRPSQRADARRREQASLEHSHSTDPELNRNPFFSTRRSSCSNRALSYSDAIQFSRSANAQGVAPAPLLPARNRPGPRPEGKKRAGVRRELPATARAP